MSSHIVRAIDVGFGNTKFVALRQGQEGIHCGVFPSIAPQASVMADMGAELFQRRNTVVVEVSGVHYEVGKDARLAQDASYGRILDQSYPLTDSYLALVRGAMYYMGVERLDILMVGLPVNNYELMRKDLERRLVGEHPIPLPRKGNELQQTRMVKVERVRALPQPIGAFFDYSIQKNSFKQMQNQMNLVIDPGYFTLDWVVAHGVKIINARSNAHPGGMSAILSSMGEAISRELGTQLTDYSAIDEALRYGTNPRFFGKEFDLSPFIPMGKEKARQFVSVLANKVGSSADIDNILLAGGGADFFRDVIAEKFPRHTIITTPDPVYANVRGFQYAGEQWLRQITGVSAATNAA